MVATTMQLMYLLHNHVQISWIHLLEAPNIMSLSLLTTRVSTCCVCLPLPVGLCMLRIVTPETPLLAQFQAKY